MKIISSPEEKKWILFAILYCMYFNIYKASQIFEYSTNLAYIISHVVCERVMCMQFVALPCEGKEARLFLIEARLE